MADTHPSDATIPTLVAAGLWKGDKESREILAAVWDPALWRGGDNAYDFERAFRMERNRRFMLGLGLAGNTLKRDRPAPKVSAPRKRRAPSKPTRKSPRSGGDVSYTAEKTDDFGVDETGRVGIVDDAYEYDTDEDDDAPRRRYSRRATLQVLTDEQRASLADAKWLEGFERWLRAGDGTTAPASDSNIKRCMPQVRKLAAGAGLAYCGWSTPFLPGVKVDMTSDLIEIWHQGKDHEARYGRDLGNGWVVNHPVKKLVLYQKYLHDKGQTAPVVAAETAPVEAPEPIQAPAPEPEAAAAPDAQAAPPGDDIAAKKAARAARFGIPIIETGATKVAADKKKKQKRAERFGMPDPGVDDEKKKARIERFKDPAAAAEEAKRQARLERFKDPTVKANEEKLKARAERFAKP